MAKKFEATKRVFAKLDDGGHFVPPHDLAAAKAEVEKAEKASSSSKSSSPKSPGSKGA